jgi:hypothetical protein
MAIGIASVIVRKRTILPHDRSPASQLPDLLADELLILPGQSHQFVTLNPGNANLAPYVRLFAASGCCGRCYIKDRVRGRADAMKKLEEKISGTAIAQ